MRNPLNMQSVSTAITSQEFQDLRTFIEAESGIALGDEKTYLMEGRLKPIVSQFACKNYGELLALAKGNKNPLVRQKLIDAITTNETLWFRDKGPFVVFEEVFMPAAVQRIRKGTAKIRVWSAASSTGQECYSLAMVIHNYLRRLNDSQIQPGNFEILGTDISSEALSVAQLGAYDRFSVERGLDPANQNLYFKQNQSFWIVDPMLKRIVTFKKFNLLDSFQPLGMFDAVFLRNVAIYFSFPTKIALVRKIRAMLPPGGLFFLGSTESLTFMPHDFLSKDYQRHVYYQAPG